jgi:hypothetical protein
MDRSLGWLASRSRLTAILALLMAIVVAACKGGGGSSGY